MTAHIKPTCNIFFKQINIPLRPSHLMIWLGTGSRIVHTGVYFHLAPGKCVGYDAVWHNGCREFDYLEYANKMLRHWNTHLHVRFLSDLTEDDVWELYEQAREMANEIDWYDFKAWLDYVWPGEFKSTKKKLICSEFVVRLLEDKYYLIGRETPDQRDPGEVFRAINEILGG